MTFKPLSAFAPSLSFKALASSALVASLSFSPLSPLTRPAQADSKDVVAGLIIGGIIGGAIASEEAKKKKKKTTKGSSKSKSTKAKAPAISPEQKAANVEVQEALNHFGWSVGTADGAIGPKSRAAIKEYQAFLGFPATGELSEHERTVLVTAYYRSKAGGAAIAEIVSGSVYGMRGVLIAQAEEMAAAPAGTLAAKDEAAPQPGSVAAAAAAAIPALLPKAEAPTVDAPAAAIVATPKPAAVAQPEPPAVVAQPEPPAVAAEIALPEPPAEPPAVVAEPEAPKVAVVAPLPEAPAVDDVGVEDPVEAKAPDPAGPGLPTFLDANGGKGTLLAACNATAMQSAGNGGLATLATLTDAGLALTEQFCLARGEAVAQGQTLMAGIAGYTPEQISAQCAGFAPLLSDHVAALSLKPRDEVLAGVEGFVLSSGMSPAQLAGTAKVCLGVGYAEERQDVAIASALILTALGERGYAELPGHHLAQGFGATERPDLAEAWYEMAAEAMGQGGAVFAPGMAGREALIIAAAYALSGKTPLAAPEAPALPTFAATPTPEAPAETAAAPLPDTATAPVSAPAAEGLMAEGPGADALRMSAGFARLAAEAPLMLLGAASQ
jgi:peptidoglycan hydrolase-like protein with peptidoglycan-binding domain